MEATDLLLDMKDNHKALLLEILERHVPAGIEVWAFGSRARWTARETSDLDLVLRNPASLDTPLKSDIIDTLKEALDESDLPFLVDLLDWATVSEKFRTVIEREYVVVRKGKRAGVRDGWKSITWGELVTLEYGKSLRDYQNGTGEIPVYGTNGPIGFTDKPLCHFPSVIIGRKGAYRGVHYSDKPFFVIDTAFYLKPITDQLDLKFAYYQLLTQDINSMDSGSAIPSTSREDFYNLEVNLPPLETQRRIAAILSSLDEKIELNRQTNRTLEAIAQALFKEWFVDFNFPGATGEMQESELGPIPKGWRVGKIKDQSSKIQYGLTQSASAEEVGPRFLRITDIQNGVIDWSTVPFCIVNEKEKEKYDIKPYDIFIARTGASTGENTLVVDPPKAVFASYLIRLQFTKPELALYVAKFLRTNRYSEFIASIKSGSAQPNANAQELTDPTIVVPSGELLKNYFEIVSELEKQKSENQFQNQQLSQTRDVLLPKLLSGEIEV